VIQFPSGGFDPAQAALGVDRGSPALGRVGGPHASVSHTVADSVTLPDAVTAALELDLFQNWDNAAARASGAAAYSQALGAASNGDHAASLQHLERSILAHPIYADAAESDQAFDAMRGDVRDLVGRVSLVARMRAEAAVGEARAAFESYHVAHPMAAAQQAGSIWRKHNCNRPLTRVTLRRPRQPLSPRRLRLVPAFRHQRRRQSSKERVLCGHWLAPRGRP